MCVSKHQRISNAMSEWSGGNEYQQETVSELKVAVIVSEYE